MWCTEGPLLEVTCMKAQARHVCLVGISISSSLRPELPMPVCIPCHTSCCSSGGVCVCREWKVTAAVRHCDRQVVDG